MSQGELFDAGEYEWPDWFTPSWNLKPIQRRVQAGLHPMGGTLLKPNPGSEKRCGNCEHIVERSRSKSWFKCAKGSQSHCSASDLRKKWAACWMYEAAHL